MVFFEYQNKGNYMSISLTIPYRRFEFFGGELSVEIAETLSRIIGIAVEVCVEVIATDICDRDDPENGSLDFTIRVSLVCPLEVVQP